MDSIVTFYFVVYLLPGILGIVARISLRETKKARFYVMVSLLLAAMMWVITWSVQNHGSEGNGILSLIISSFSIGMVLCEMCFLIWRRIKRKRL